jgi:hypothetical protein
MANMVNHRELNHGSQILTPNVERDQLALVQSVVAVERWQETMRAPEGYGGPVVHWWRNCWHYTGVGLDWRYEGIINGYANLYRKTGDRQWLAKARRAGDDLCVGQLADGNFRFSSFELNPYPAGRPHEAAADLGLLVLAETLKATGDADWTKYLATAEKNLRLFYIAQLWDAQLQAFCDDPRHTFFVPNKAATSAEAVFKWARLTGDHALIEQYALPTLEAVMKLQVPKGALRGGVYQYRVGNRVERWCFPYYAGRCIPALLEAYTWTHEERYLNAAVEAGAFMLHWRDADGAFLQVVYEEGRLNRYPRWIAGVGDMLHALALLNEHGFACDLSPSVEWLLAGQLPSGGFRSGQGFAAQGSQRTPSQPPDFRDVLPVCGWNDKAFRYLTARLPQNCVLPVDEGAATSLDCTLKNTRMQYYEDAEVIEARHHKTVVYRWRKGQAWAEVCDNRWLQK